METSIEHRDHSYSVDEVIQHLEGFVTEPRLLKMQSVVLSRMTSVIPVVENLYDRGNVSAVMRSSEGLGFHEMHIIQTHERFKEANRVTQGADKWLATRQFKSTANCLENLKSRGYKVCVTSLEGAKPLAEIDFTTPTAIVFGNEKEGASPEMLAGADEIMKIPMLGFTQSFNISVAAAITLYHIQAKLQPLPIAPGQPMTDMQKSIYAQYLLKSVGNAEKILERELSKI